MINKNSENQMKQPSKAKQIDENPNFDVNMETEEAHYGNPHHFAFYNEHKIFDLIDSVKQLFCKKEYGLAMKFIDKNIPGFLDCKTFIKFKMIKFHFYQTVLENQTEAKKFYDQVMVNYLKKNSKTFAEKDWCFNRIILEPSLLTTNQIILKGQQNIEDFFQIMYKEILEFLHGNSSFGTPSNDFYFCLDSHVDYESDFEKEIVNQSNPSIKTEKFQSIESFKDFAQNDRFSECIDFLKNTLHSLPNIIKEQEPICKNIQQNHPAQQTPTLIKENSHISTKSEDSEKKKNVSQNPNQMFKVLKNSNEFSGFCGKQKLPYSRRFNPKFTKRENIDKKIVRKFRKFLKETYWKHPQLLDFSQNKELWLKFINEDLFPPVNFSYLGKIFNFKSFNTSYICWLFSQKNADDLFFLFIKEKGQSLFQSVVEKYWRKINELPDNERTETTKHLESYINNFAVIYNTNNFDMATTSFCEEQSESMPAANPNTTGSVTDHIDGNVIEPDFDIVYKKDKGNEIIDNNLYKYE